MENMILLLNVMELIEKCAGWFSTVIWQTILFFFDQRTRLPSFDLLAHTWAKHTRSHKKELRFLYKEEILQLTYGENVHRVTSIIVCQKDTGGQSKGASHCKIHGFVLELLEVYEVLEAWSPLNRGVQTVHDLWVHLVSDIKDDLAYIT